MKQAIQWSTEAPPGLDLGTTTIDQANEIVTGAGQTPLTRATVNALYRAGWGRAANVIHGDAKELLFKASIGPTRTREIDNWRTALLRLIEPDGEVLTTAERTVLNYQRRKGEEVDPAAVRGSAEVQSLRDQLLELALLVPHRPFASEMRQWLMEVARG